MNHDLESIGLSLPNNIPPALLSAIDEKLRSGPAAEARYALLLKTLTDPTIKIEADLKIFLMNEMKALREGTPDAELRAYLELLEKNPYNAEKFISVLQLQLNKRKTDVLVRSNNEEMKGSHSAVNFSTDPISTTSHLKVQHVEHPHGVEHLKDKAIYKLAKMLKDEYKQQRNKELLNFVKLRDEVKKEGSYLSFFEKEDSTYRYSIIGPVGSGKRSILEDLRYNWASGKLFSTYTFVFFICMRDLINKCSEYNQNVDYPHILEDSCFKFKFGYSFEDIENKSIIAYLNNYKDNILWLIEGYDDMPENINNIKHFIKHILSFKNVILTARSELTFDNTLNFKKLYILPLTDSQIGLYLNEQIKKNQDINYRLAFYENNKSIIDNTIKNLVSIESVLCNILKQKLTLTQLYIKLFEFLLARYHSRYKLNLIHNMKGNLLENYYKPQLKTLYKFSFDIIDKSNQSLEANEDIFIMGVIYKKSSGHFELLDDSTKCFLVAKYLSEEFINSQDKKNNFQKITNVFKKNNTDPRLIARFLSGLMIDTNEYWYLFSEMLSEYIKVDYDLFLRNDLKFSSKELLELFENQSIAKDLKVIAKEIAKETLLAQDYLKLENSNNLKDFVNILEKAIYPTNNNFKKLISSLFKRKSKEKINLLILWILSLEERFGGKIYSAGKYNSDLHMKFAFVITIQEKNILEKFKNYAFDILITNNLVEKKELLEVINQSPVICKRLIPSVETYAMLHEKLLESLTKQETHKNDNIIIDILIDIYHIDRNLFANILAQKFNNEDLKALSINMQCTLQDKDYSSDIISDIHESLNNNQPNNTSDIYDLMKILLTAATGVTVVGGLGVSLGIIGGGGFLLITLLAAISAVVVILNELRKNENTADASKLDSVCDKLLSDPIRLIFIYKESKDVNELCKFIIDKWDIYPFLSKALLCFLYEDNHELYDKKIHVIKEILKYKAHSKLETLIINKFTFLKEQEKIQIFRIMLKAYQENGNIEIYDLFLRRILLSSPKLGIESICRVLSSLDLDVPNDNKFIGIRDYVENRITESMLEVMLALYTPSIISILLIINSKLKIFFDFAIFCDILDRTNEKTDEELMSKFIKLFLSPILFNVEKFKKDREIGLNKGSYYEVMGDNIDNYIRAWKFTNFCSILKWICKDEHLSKIYINDILLIRNDFIGKAFPNEENFILIQALLDEAYFIEARKIFNANVLRQQQNFKEILNNQLQEKNHVKIWKSQERNDKHSKYKKTNEGKTSAEETQELRTTFMKFKYNLDNINKKMISLADNVAIKEEKIKALEDKHPDYLEFDDIFRLIRDCLTKIEFSKYLIAHWDSYISDLLDYMKGIDKKHFATYKILINRINLLICMQLQSIYKNKLYYNREIFCVVLEFMQKGYLISKNLENKISEKLNDQKCIINREIFYSNLFMHGVSDANICNLYSFWKGANLNLKKYIFSDDLLRILAVHAKIYNHEKTENLFLIEFTDYKLALYFSRKLSQIANSVLLNKFELREPNILIGEGDKYIIALNSNEFNALLDVNNISKDSSNNLSDKVNDVSLANKGAFLNLSSSGESEKNTDNFFILHQPLKRKEVKSNNLQRNVEILNMIGSEDKSIRQLGYINIARGEVSFSIKDLDSYYTADVINILLYPLNQLLHIQIYSAIPPEQLNEFVQRIASQQNDYAFIPLYVAYDANNSTHKNHWAALIIDKKNRQIFYLDPARKTCVPKEVEELNKNLGYKESIILNQIDFQEQEKQDGFIRHCGVYVVEIFEVFATQIQKHRNVVKNQLPEDKANESNIPLQSVLSIIPSGEAENIKQIRERHIDKIHAILLSEWQNIPSVQHTHPASFEIHPNQAFKHLRERSPQSNYNPTLFGHAKKDHNTLLRKETALPPQGEIRINHEEFEKMKKEANFKKSEDREWIDVTKDDSQENLDSDNDDAISIEDDNKSLYLPFSSISMSRKNSLN